MIGWPALAACCRACWLGEESQQPMCPHCAHRRRWNHQPPLSSQSAHPVPLGGADGSMPDTAPADICTPPSRGENGMEPGTYGTDGTDPEEASGVLEPEDTLEDSH